MTRPTDAAIARAFWEIHGDNMDGLIDGDSVIEMAAEFDAESPAGTDRGSEEGDAKCSQQPQSRKREWACSARGGG